MQRALLTGFEPFGSYRFNPTQELAREYDRRTLGDIEVIGLVLPCTYYGAFEALSESMDRLSPDLVLSMGLSSLIPRLRLEAIGRNIMNGKYADADGVKPDCKPLVEGAQNSFRAHADVIQLAQRLHEAGVSVDVSVDAEGFICNSLLYLTSKRIHDDKLHVRNAFFHTPWTEDYLDRIQLEPGKITVRKEDLRRGIEVLLKEMGRSE